MQAFTSVDEIGVPFDMANVDTDQIIPARFLKQPRDERYAGYLFRDVRLNEDGSEKPDFILNQPSYREGRILVSDRNFGCGSSREAAVYVLQDFGFRAVIAPSFGDIFYNNSFKNGFLPVRLDAEVVADIRRQLRESPGARIAIDLERQIVTAPDGSEHAFDVDAFRKYCLLKGLDDIEFTLEHRSDIDSFETDYAARQPWRRRNA